MGIVNLNASDMSDNKRKYNELLRAASIERAEYYSNMSDDEYRKIEDAAYDDSGNYGDYDGDHGMPPEKRFSDYDRLLAERDRIDLESRRAEVLKQLDDYQY